MMADEIQEEEPQASRDESEDDHEGEDPKLRDDDGEIEEEKDEEEDGEGKGSEEGEGKEDEEGETEIEDDKKLTKEERNRKKAEEKKKSKEDAKKKAEEDKQRKEEEAKKKKENAAKAKQEKEDAAEAKRKEQKAKPPTPKAALKTYFMALAGVLLIYSFCALGIASYAMDSAIKFRSAVSEDMEVYCREEALLPGCLTVPEIALAGFYTMLGWSLLAVLASLLAFHGVLLERTGSFTTFVVINAVLIPVQIAVTTLTVILRNQLQDNPNLVCAEEGEEGCGEILLDELKQTIAKLWAYESVQDFLGCEDAEAAQDVVDCFISLYSQAAVAIACVLMIPVLFQAPAIYLALAVRSRVIAEQGMDLFAMCRITYGLRVCMMSTVLFVILFGFVVAAVVPTKP